ncbi:hypothetical protein Nmel_005629, partial [Mimus melanotis]
PILPRWLCRTQPLSPRYPAVGTHCREAWAAGAVRKTRRGPCSSPLSSPCLRTAWPNYPGPGPPDPRLPGQGYFPLPPLAAPGRPAMCGAVPPLSSTPAGGREPPWPAASPLLAATSPGRPLRRAESSCLRSYKPKGTVTRGRAVSSPRQHVRHQIRRLRGRTTGVWGRDAAPPLSTCSSSGPRAP